MKQKDQIEKRRLEDLPGKHLKGLKGNRRSKIWIKSDEVKIKALANIVIIMRILLCSRVRFFNVEPALPEFNANKFSSECWRQTRTKDLHGKMRELFPRVNRRMILADTARMSY